MMKEAKTEVQVTKATNDGVSNDKKESKPQSPKDATFSAIKRLVSDREDWEKSVYRTSNQALYSILRNCYAIDWAMKGNESAAKQRREGLADVAKEFGYSFRESTPTITKIVKCVFGNVKRSRICTYSLVLREAKKQNKAIAGIPQFIEESGGVEQIRLSKSVGYKTAKQKADLARQSATSSLLGVASGKALSELADGNFVDKQCVLLATQQADGSFAVNAVVRAQAALTAALVGYYGSGTAIRADMAAKQEAANDSDACSQMIQEIVNRK